MMYKETQYTLDKLISSMCCTSCHHHIEIAMQRLQDVTELNQFKTDLLMATNKPKLKKSIEDLFIKHTLRKEIQDAKKAS